VLDALDAAAVRRWCAAGLEALQRARGEIDRLNVYPVADRDTGTNLVLTMQSVADALKAVDGPADLAATVKAMSQGALTGARGNSGVILSGFLRGFGESVRGGATAGGTALVQALERAADAGYAAVAEPVEGTVLTVARAAAQAARATRSTDLPTVARAAAKGAHEALSRTPSQLSVLARAGVVDAGGRGLCVLLDTLVVVVTGEPATAGDAVEPLPSGDPRSPGTDDEVAADRYAYEVQYLLDAGEDSVPMLKAALAGLGGSVAVDGDNGLWNVHAHVNDVGAAVEAGVQAGRPHRITVTPFHEVPGTSISRRSVLALAPSGPVAALFEAADAMVVSGQPGHPILAADLFAAIDRSGATELAVLPNDAAARAVADEAARLARKQGVTVAVVPTRSLVQGLAALGVHDPECAFADDVIAMSAAAAATRWADISIATTLAQTSAGICQAGDVLGLLEGDVAMIGREPLTVACQLLDRMLAGGGELVTMVTGADAAALGDRLHRHVSSRHPTVETVAFAGGQRETLLMIGVE
jgi:DAK2 domain fusion protein YloV